jgi:hypothetical protein
VRGIPQSVSWLRAPAWSGLLHFVVLALLSGAAGCKGGSSTAPKPNSPPILVSQADTTAAIGDTLRLQAVAHDSDGDALAYSATIFISYEEFRAGYLPRGGMSPSTGAFWFLPNRQDAPSRRVRVEVDDGHGGRDSTNFVVRVLSR